MVKQIKLNYALGDLEPYIDKETMNIHYNKHHAAYTNNTTAILDELKIYSDNPKVVFKRASKNSGLRNNGGGWWNHNFFFEALNKPGLNKISSKFEELISRFPYPQSGAEVYAKASFSLLHSGAPGLAKVRIQDAIDIFPSYIYQLQKARIDMALSDFDSAYETLSNFP
ncbi:MAG: hypothetical protein ABGX43_05375, partial [Nitrospinaceae bacterium]